MRLRCLFLDDRDCVGIKNNNFFNCQIMTPIIIRNEHLKNCLKHLGMVAKLHLKAWMRKGDKERSVFDIDKGDGFLEFGLEQRDKFGIAIATV